MKKVIKECPNCGRKIIFNKNHSQRCLCGKIIKNDSSFVNFMKKCIGR